MMQPKKQDTREVFQKDIERKKKRISDCCPEAYKDLVNKM